MKTSEQQSRKDKKMDPIALEAKESMAKTIQAFQNELTTLRTGRATPAMLDRVECEYYGDKIAVNQISSISSPEPRQLLVKPYDKGDVKNICAAIAAANLGVNPINEGDCIRITIAPLTEETRRDLVKKAKAMSEDSKVAIRNIRRDFIDLVKASDEMTEDLQKRVQEEIENVTKDSVAEIDSILAKKESEIMAI
ncbi:MAG: ribosome recycling factor [Bacilli bacterium]|nr:ribosome recycling factor [Bacilli bacterium]